MTFTKKNKQDQVTTTNLKQRFFLWSTLIMLAGGLVLAVLSYWNTRRILMDEALTKSEVILQEVEAIRSYVKDELRPKMNALHGRDSFIIEAMSTTYISTSIMNRFAHFMPNYIYRRASVNPHNPRNKADPFEEEMLDWFELHPEKKFWQGVVKKGGNDFFISLVPDYFTPACIRCHGKAEDAPQSLLDTYGTVGGFRFTSGDLAGIDSVAIPVSASLRKAWQASLFIFSITLCTTVFWLWLLNLLFQRLVIERLGAMLALVAEKKKGNIPGHGDELDVLQASLGSLSSYVRSARKGSGLEPNFIGTYVVSRPVVAGAISWLYNGYDTHSKDNVALKFGFDEVLQNPLYRACLETELQLFHTLKHPCLPEVRERIDDVLILEAIPGRSLFSFLDKKTLERSLLLPIFSQICDLAATLHATGIIHHDLRPHIFMLDTDQHIVLVDMGLATSDLLPDPIVAAGLGPQGDMQYMAPEQIRGKRNDPRSDIYTIGILLYQAITGHLPFDEQQKTPGKWLSCKEQVIPPRTFCKDIPQALEQVLLRTLHSDADLRYQWVEDLWEDLQNAYSNDNSL